MRCTFGVLQGLYLKTKGRERMAIETDGRKERYYKLALAKGNEIYASWATSSAVSKRIVAKANEYAFNKRLKTDALYRFHVLAFMVALGLRLEKRYATFLRKLFRLFAYLRERNALKMLKRVFGFYGDTDMREILDMEAVKIIVLLSNRKNGQSTGGGKRFEMGDITVEEEVNNFFEECIQEDEQKSVDNNLETDADKNLDANGKSLFKKEEDVQREKISVEEFEKGEQVVEHTKKSNAQTKIEQIEKQATEPLDASNTNNIKAEKSIEKTATNTSILTEITILTQDKEEGEPSPFPIFKPNPENKPAEQSKEKLGLETGKTQTEPTTNNGEKLDKDILAKNEQEKSPFPVFNKEEVDLIKSLEKTDKKEVKEVKEIKVDKEIHSLEGINAPTEIIFEEEKMLHALSEISEENKLRLARHDQMTKEELKAIISTIKESAKVIMEQEEQAWREKISVEEGGNLGQSSSKITDSTQNNMSSKKELKK